MKALLLVALLVAPVALADHVYSHRYVLEGRLLGADGAPLPGREITLASERDDFLEPCREGPQRSVTDGSGDFHFCFHHHEIEPGALVTVSAGNASATRAVDVALRRTHVILHEPNETGAAPEGWNATYRVSGRAWRVGVHELEGIQVYGEAVRDLPVNLTVRDAQGGESVFRTTTDAFGDYDLLVETNETPADLSLTLEALGRAQPTQLDAQTHRTYAPIYLAPKEDAKAASVEPPEDAPELPGSTTPRVNPVLLVALALALVAAMVLSKRKRS